MNLTKHEETKKGSLFHENEKLRIFVSSCSINYLYQVVFFVITYGFYGFYWANGANRANGFMGRVRVLRESWRFVVEVLVDRRSRSHNLPFGSLRPVTTGVLSTHGPWLR